MNNQEDCKVSWLGRKGSRGGWKHDSNVKFDVKMNESFDDKVFNSLLSVEPQLDAYIA